MLCSGLLVCPDLYICAQAYAFALPSSAVSRYNAELRRREGFFGQHVPYLVDGEPTAAATETPCAEVRSQLRHGAADKLS
jgi:hypothetical protein